MKKLISAVLAAVLVVGLGTTVVKAANSPTAEDVVTLANAVEVESTQGTTTAMDLDSIQVANNTLRAWIVSEYQKMGNQTSVVDGDSIVLGENGTPLGAAAEPELLAAFDFVPSASVVAEIEKKGFVEITFDVDSITSPPSMSVYKLSPYLLI